MYAKKRGPEANENGRLSHGFGRDVVSSRPAVLKSSEGTLPRIPSDRAPKPQLKYAAIAKIELDGIDFTKLVKNSQRSRDALPPSNPLSYETQRSHGIEQKPPMIPKDVQSSYRVSVDLG